jgi:hypothetical protein
MSEEDVGLSKRMRGLRLSRPELSMLHPDPTVAKGVSPVPADDVVNGPTVAPRASNRRSVAIDFPLV